MRDPSRHILSTNNPSHSRPAVSRCIKANAVEDDGVDNRLIDMALQLADAAASVTTKFFRYTVSSS